MEDFHDMSSLSRDMVHTRIVARRHSLRLFMVAYEDRHQTAFFKTWLVESQHGLVLIESGPSLDKRFILILLLNLVEMYKESLHNITIHYPIDVEKS